MHYLSVERYGYGEGPLQAWDARLKVGGLLLVLIVIGFQPLDSGVSGWIPLAAVGVLLGGLLGGSGLPVPKLILRSFIVLPFAGFVALAQLIAIGPVDDPALPLFGGWGIAVRDGGGARAALLITRVWLSILATLAVVATTPFPKLLAVMEWARAPRGFVQIVGILYRTLWILVEEARHMTRARRLRAFRKRGWLFSLAGAGIVATLFQRTLEKSSQLYRAMLLRGYRGSVPLVERLRWTSADTWRFASLLVFLGGTVTLATLRSSSMGPSP